MSIDETHSMLTEELSDTIKPGSEICTGCGRRGRLSVLAAAACFALSCLFWLARTLEL
jgi:hypothetical protein